MPGDSIPAPWPEASAEGSARARPPLKRWGFRCLARPTRVLETDWEPHVEASRFPGKGGREGGRVDDQRAEVAGTFAGTELRCPGQRVTRDDDFGCLPVVTCEQATGHTATCACRQKCKLLGGPARCRASQRPNRRSLGLPVRRPCSPAVMLSRCPIGISANGRTICVAYGQGGRSAGGQVVQTAACLSGAHAPRRAGK